MARVIGKKQGGQEVWYLCRQYSATEAVQIGLANMVASDVKLETKMDRWCAETLEKDPTTLALAKRSL